MSEIGWPLPETKETYTMQYKGAPWIEGGEGRYDGLTLQQAQEEVARIKAYHPHMETRYVKATTTYEFAMEV